MFNHICNIPRRTVLQIGGTGLFGLTLPKLLQAAESPIAKPGRAKSVIFLYQFGGPSHLDTFDPKPHGPDGVRSHYGVIDTSVPGLQIADKLPKMATMMRDVTLVRTVHHNMKNHNPAAYYALTGHAPPLDDIRLRDSQDLFPAYGSVVDRLTPNTNGMPTFVALPHVLRDGEITPGQHASFLGKGHDPLLITSDPNDRRFALPELSLPRDLSVDRVQNRREIQKLVNSQLKELDQTATARGLDAYYEKSLGMLNSTKVREAFNLDAEPASVRDKYGRTTYGQSCLLARRLVEAGVKFVNVYFAKSIGGANKADGWDTHGFNNVPMYPILSDYLLPQTELTLPTLITDLKERGLFESTLIVWMGEFGRTPRLNDIQSRDHWPSCYSALLAGGGVKRGFVHGTSDKQGAFPDKDPVALDDLMATVFELIGIPPQTELRDKLNRPLAVSSGRVTTELIA